MMQIGHAGEFAAKITSLLAVMIDSQQANVTVPGSLTLAEGAIVV
jgi:hypothetical protein